VAQKVAEYRDFLDVTEVAERGIDETGRRERAERKREKAEVVRIRCRDKKQPSRLSVVQDRGRVVKETGRKERTIGGGGVDGLYGL